MTTVLLVAAAAGTICGLARLNIWPLILATIVFSITTTIDGRVTGQNAGTIALTLFIGATLLQLFYLIVSFVLETGSKPSRLEVVRAMRAAIGQEMRMSCPFPIDLPPELEVRLAQLTVRCG